VVVASVVVASVVVSADMGKTSRVGGAIT